MNLIEIKDQSRRDFTGVYQCEHCGNIEEHSGYDDRNFHDNVTPRWECENCGKSSIDKEGRDTHVPTKYREDEIV